MEDTSKTPERQVVLDSPKTGGCGNNVPFSRDDRDHQQHPVVKNESDSSHQPKSIEQGCKQVIVLEDLKDGTIVDVPSDRAPWPLCESPNCKPNGPSDRGSESSKRGIGLCHQLSPATGWPQRSPMKSDLPNHHHEEASFTLFTQSFDTLSETGNYLSEMERTKDHTPRKIDDGPPRRIDLTHDGNDAANSFGDISPIKLGDDTIRPGLSQQHRRLRMGRQSASKSHDPTRKLDFVTIPNYENYHNGLNRPGVRPFETYNGSRNIGGMISQVSSASNPFYVLRSAYKAFSGCTYLLPCLKDRIVCPVNISRYGNIRNYNDELRTPDETDVKIATRRVEAAICAFGGYLQSKKQEPCRPATSIFRLRGSNQKSPSKDFYDSRFHRRYFVHGNHVSWDVEENPPITAHQESRDPHQRTGRQNESIISGRDSPKNNDGPYDQSCSRQDSTDQEAGNGSQNSSAGSTAGSENQQKMKYRCKLCGQLKQNHNCPYQQSLQRSIAVMVYPAVNAFTASEPGILTKPLSEMNNFVSYESLDTKQEGSLDTAYTCNKGHIGADFNRSHFRITNITPETAKNRLLNSPESSLSTHSHDPSSPHHHHGQRHHHRHHYPNHQHGIGSISTNEFPLHSYQQHETRKRSFTDANEGYPAINRSFGSVGREGIFRDCIHGHPFKKPSSPPFAATLALRPEHYRAVTPRTTAPVTAATTAAISSSEEGSSSVSKSAAGDGRREDGNEGDYNYPPVPLTFGERKRLSDTLFILSQDIPNLTMDISGLLRHAREVDEWDLAVAELLAQIVVGIHCKDYDYRLDGLQQYLLGMGISC